LDAIDFDVVLVRVLTLIGEMLRDLARKRVQIAPAIQDAILKSRDGNPRAQARMAARIRRAGAALVDLSPGRRGRYTLAIHELVGWNPNTGKEIGVDDVILDLPWAAIYLTVIVGRARVVKSKLMMLMTHHALSRCAQRFKLRTPEHVFNATCNVWVALVAAFGIIKERWYDEFFPTPMTARHVRINDAVTAVVQRYHDPVCDPEGRRQALVVLTMVPSLDEPVPEN